MKKLLIVVNDPLFFLSHRLCVAQEAAREGFDVHVATSAGAGVSKILSLGFCHHALPLTRSGVNIFQELTTLISLWVLLLRLRPTILHLVTIKPVIYGGLAARLAPVKGVVAAISGLGFVFIASDKRTILVRRVVTRLYRWALGKPNLYAIFQNPDDRDTLIEAKSISPEKTVLVRGSGVDLSRYRMSPELTGTPVITLAARLLRDKGIMDFVDAARLLRRRGLLANFKLVGDVDLGNPTSFNSDELEQWRSEGVVECLGYRDDIAHIFESSHVVVLPSYREGLPKVLLEAAACGRAVITTNVPGCRDAIEPGVTGLLVPVRNHRALADAIQTLVEDAELRQRLGKAGRELAEREFAIEKIVQQHLDIYHALEKKR